MKKFYHILYPMRVVLISASSRGKDNFMPACWCFPLSFEPQLFGVAISKKRFTYGLVHESGEYVINIPGEELLGKIKEYGRLSGKDIDKFEKAGLTREKSEMINAVSINECQKSIECKVVQEIEIGDHVIFVGEVKNIKIRKEGKGIYEKGGELVVL